MQRRGHCSCWFIDSCINDRIGDDLALMTHQQQQLPTSDQIAGSHDTPTTNLSYMAQSCIIITSTYSYLPAPVLLQNNIARIPPHSRPGVILLDRAVHVLKCRGFHTDTEALYGVGDIGEVITDRR